MCVFVCVHIFAGLNAAINHWNNGDTGSWYYMRSRRSEIKGYEMVSQNAAMASF